MTPRAKTTKAKIDIWDYNKLENFSVSEYTFNGVKLQPTEWEKIFANLALAATKYHTPGALTNRHLFFTVL